jgi:predicted ABC-type ATPase
MPVFTIIAGPNGAGKSTFSAILSSDDALIFDADKVKSLREKQYPDVPAESIEMMIDSAYWEAEEIAFKEKRDLTVETNLRDDFLIKRSIFFREKGYTTNLIYILLPDIGTSIERVGLRVKQKGHFIDENSIRYNFEQGLTILKQHFNKFDNMNVFNSPLNINDDPALITFLTINNNVVTFLESNPPLWAKSTINELIQNLPKN